MSKVKIRARTRQNSRNPSIPSMSGSGSDAIPKRVRSTRSFDKSHEKSFENGASPSGNGKSAKSKLRKIIAEEKEYGVDHIDDDIIETGNSHCLQAYLDYRAASKPYINSNLVDFASQFELMKKLRCAGELFEVRQCKDIHT